MVAHTRWWGLKPGFIAAPPRSWNPSPSVSSYPQPLVYFSTFNAVLKWTFCKVGWKGGLPYFYTFNFKCTVAYLDLCVGWPASYLGGSMGTIDRASKGLQALQSRWMLQCKPGEEKICCDRSFVLHVFLFRSLYLLWNSVGTVLPFFLLCIPVVQIVHTENISKVSHS